jgi:hypothetical protein
LCLIHARICVVVYTCSSLPALHLNGS